ncbi:MAG: hypothetical protein HC871_17015 [Rhizobiales bacterium]|nr:hypothetical protein [Hyphomicrobiales bacterium]
MVGQSHPPCILLTRPMAQSRRFARDLRAAVPFSLRITISPLMTPVLMPDAVPKDTAAALEALGLQAGAEEDYERRRFAAGVPEGSAELGIDKSPLLELGFEELNGVDFKKGCFVGQELTARMKYRGLVRKRLMPVTFAGAAPEPGAVIKAGARDIGDLRTASTHGGFAVLRLDKLEESAARGERLCANDVAVTPIKPEWVNF